MSKARAALGTTGIFADTEPKRGAEQVTSLSRPDREGRVPMPFWTSISAKRQLRVLAAEEDTTQQHLMGEALNLLFRKHGKPPIA